MAEFRDKIYSKHSTITNELKRTLDTFEEKLELVHKLFYKMHILKHLKELLTCEDLDSEENYALQYIRLNPNLLIIFDDSASHFKQYEKSPIVRDFFYRNRHVNITSVFCCQDDTDLGSNLRKNVFMSFFTREGVATSYFNRKSNGITNEIARAIATDVCVAIEPTTGIRFVYLRDDPKDHNFYYADIEDAELVDFVPDYIKELCERVSANNSVLDTKNPFYASFELDSKKR